MLSYKIIAFGVVQILVGLLSIILSSDGPITDPGGWTSLGPSQHLDALYIELGLVSIVANIFPSDFTVGFAAFLNILGSLVSAVRSVLYVMDVKIARKVCGWNSSNPDCSQALTVSATLNILTVLQLTVCLVLTCLNAEVLFCWKKGGSDVQKNDSVEKELLLPRTTV